MSYNVNEAIIESYALMLFVMATFFIYFCIMVWAFSNPKFSGAEEDAGMSPTEAAFTPGKQVSLEMIRIHKEHLQQATDPSTDEVFLENSIRTDRVSFTFNYNSPGTSNLTEVIA